MALERFPFKYLTVKEAKGFHVDGLLQIDGIRTRCREHLEWYVEERTKKVQIVTGERDIPLPPVIRKRLNDYGMYRRVHRLVLAALFGHKEGLRDCKPRFVIDELVERADVPAHQAIEKLIRYYKNSVNDRRLSYLLTEVHGDDPLYPFYTKEHDFQESVTGRERPGCRTLTWPFHIEE